MAANSGVNGVELGVVLFFFILVTAGGFFAVRWRRADSMQSLDEWGLGGRGFGTFITYFLLGGDLYTAYTFIAVPAAMFATGAVSGFFAVPYTIIVYPIIFIFMPRLWSVSHRHGYVTPADFVRGRYDSRILALAVAVTGIIATMPYIALQLVGIQAVLDTMGIGGSGNTFVKDLPLIVAFAVLAAYTYSSGLRAPALIAFVKDGLIYLVIIVAIVYVAVKIGFGGVFDSAQTKMNTVKNGKPTGSFVPPSSLYWAYGTLAFGSALALFMYPHSVTAVLSGRSRNVIRRNAVILPTYSLMLGLLALLGFVAIHEKTSVFGQDGKANPQLAVPHLFDQIFPDWFAGVAFAAIAIGALVPAAIMSIAAANLFTRNIYREFLRPHATPAHEARVAKITSLVVKFGALLFVLGMDRQNAINLQLLGGVWILQTLLAIVVGLYTRWFHRWALLAGWAVAMVYGTVTAYRQTVPNASTRLVDGKPVTTVHGMRHFGTSLADFPGTTTKVYIAVTALLLNIAVAVVLTLVFRLIKAPAGTDATQPGDYYSDAPSKGVIVAAEDVIAADAPERTRAPD
ncbi:MAG: sodium:solute symporter [Pseudonocardiales bacterium]